jgi:hypothetical protein
MDVTRRVELPDGRLLAFRGDQVVGFNLIEAQRHARRGARTRLKAIEELYRRDDGMWGIGDPSSEIDLFSDLAAAVLFSFAAVEGLGDPPSGGRPELVRLRRLRDGLVGAGAGPGDTAIFGRLLVGEADSCADDAIAYVSALRPDLVPSELR